MSISALAEFLSANGIWMLFLLIALDNLGIPGYPGGFTLPAVGVLMRMDLLEIPTGFLICLTASTLMMAVIYWVGLHFGDWVSGKLMGSPRFVKSYDRLKALIQRYGSPALFIARLIPVVRVFVSITAGLLHMEWKRYCFFSFFSNLLYTIGALVVGYFATSFFV